MAPSVLSKQTFWIGLCLIALAGLLVLRLSTSWGALWHRDSFSYVNFAKQLQSGLVYANYTHRPPLYPALLALFGNIGGIVPTGWWLNAIVLAANSVLLGYTVYRVTDRAVVYGLLAALFAVAAPDLLEIHATLFSEPLFAFFVLACFLALVNYRQLHSGLWCFLAGVALAFAILQRYSGLPLLPIGWFTIVFFSTIPPAKKIRHILIFSITATMPIAALFVFNLAQTGNAVDRTLSATNFQLFNDLLSLGDGIAVWFAVGSLPRVFRLGIVGVIGLAIVLCFAAIMRTRPDNIRTAHPLLKPYLATHGVFLAGYSAFLVLSRWLFDPALFIYEPRIISILHYSVIALICCLLYAISELVKHSRARPVGIALHAGAALWLVAMLASSALWASARGRDPTDTGNTNVYPYRKNWAASPTIEMAKTLPADVIYMAFEPEILLMLTSRTTVSFYGGVWHIPTLTAADYAAGMEKTKALVAGRKIALVYFNKPFTFTFNRRTLIPPSADEIAKVFGLRLWATEADGTIWVSE